MKNIFYAIILITFLQNCSSDTYMNVIFEPKLEKFCGTYYMENFFYQKHHLNPKDTIKKKDGLQFCLGSYDTAIYITQINVKKFELTFIIKNKTGWESGTRWLNDNDGNPHNDSVLNDKTRGVGIHLGGTIAQTYGWKETIKKKKKK